MKNLEIKIGMVIAHFSTFDGEESHRIRVLQFIDRDWMVVERSYDQGVTWMQPFQGAKTAIQAAVNGVNRGISKVISS